MKGNFKENDVFSESSKYIFKGIKPDGKTCIFLHYPSLEEVQLSKDYVLSKLVSADQYDTEVIVTKEDKRDGVLGIRSIFQGLDNTVFTVCFRTANKELSEKKYKELKEQQVKTLLERINKAQKSKTGVLNEAESCLKELQENNIVPIIKGEERVLRGFKTQFTSNDGKYNVIDLDFPDSAGNANIRQVNINEIHYLIFNGTKYIVK